MQFDPTSRRLRLDPDAFERLVDAARRASTGVDAQLSPDDPLVTTGAAEPDGTPAEGLRPALQAVLWPVAAGDVLLVDATRFWYHQVWLAPTAVAVLADLALPGPASGGEGYDLLTGLPEHLPSLVATLVGLGPRGPLDQQPLQGSARLPLAVWQALLDADAPDRTPAVRAAANALTPVWPAVGAALVSGAWRAWLAGLGGAAGDRALLALDTDAGVARGVIEGDEVVLVGVRPEDLWFDLVRLLPPDPA